MKFRNDIIKIKLLIPPLEECVVGELKVYYRKVEKTAYLLEKNRQKLKYSLMVNQNAGAEEDYRHT